MFLQKLMKKINRRPNYEEQSSVKDIEIKEKNIPTTIDDTKAIFCSLYSIPTNQDVSVRTIYIDGLKTKAFLVYINTITDIELIDTHVMEPLLQHRSSNQKVEDIVTIQTVKKESIIKEIVTEINKGNTMLFVDGEAKAYILSTSNFESRSIEKSDNEPVIKGPKEAFTEKAKTNISLIRKKIKNENLVVESITISKRSKNELFVVYEKDLVNEELLNNLKERVNALDVDSIQNLSLLEQHIEERRYSIFPTILYTERPDRATSFIEDGYIVLLMDNSPDSLVLPATFWSFYHTSEDHYLRFFMLTLQDFCG